MVFLAASFDLALSLSVWYLAMCEFVSCRDGVCREGVLFVQLDVFIVLLCQVSGKSRDIVLSASPWNVLSGCRMNNLHKAIIVFRGWIDVTYACV